jgi:hypothetical protein
MCYSHEISIPPYAIEQQRGQPGVPNNEISLMSLINKNDARLLARWVTMLLPLKNC